MIAISDRLYAIVGPGDMVEHRWSLERLDWVPMLFSNEEKARAKVGGPYRLVPCRIVADEGAGSGVFVCSVSDGAAPPRRKQRRCRRGRR